MSTTVAITAPKQCSACGTEVAPGLKVCPGCARLVHAEKLKELAEQAERLEVGGDLADALSAWRGALSLLPVASGPHQQVAERVARLNQQVAAQAAAERAATPAWQRWSKEWKRLGSVGVVLAVLGKLKFLALGLLKLKTVLSMAVMFAVYARLWGWPFTLGFVLLIYVHEMGHVAKLNRYGIRATAPMFIPGFGALILLREYPSGPAEEARVGLAGPIWGVAGTLVCLLGYALWRQPLLLTLAGAGAWLNLFNLLPFWQLDGAHAFAALTTWQRGLATAGFALAWLLTRNGLLLILVAVCAIQAWRGRQRETQHSDWSVLAQMAGLIAALSPLLRFAF